MERVILTMLCMALLTLPAHAALQTYMLAWDPAENLPPATPPYRYMYCIFEAQPPTAAPIRISCVWEDTRQYQVYLDPDINPATACFQVYTGIHDGTNISQYSAKPATLLSDPRGEWLCIDPKIPGSPQGLRRFQPGP